MSRALRQIGAPAEPAHRFGVASERPVRWADVAAAEPELAAAGEELLQAFTLAFLATVREDGGPRVHPVTITVQGGV